MKPTYSQIKTAYPGDESKAELFQLLGSNWDPLVGEDSYNNTCAIRISHAFNKLGVSVPKKYGTADGGHTEKGGKHVMIKMLTGQKFLKDIYGDTTWGMSKNAKEPFNFADLPDRTGILVYKAKFDSGANGHIDVWDGKACQGNCPAIDVSEAYEIAMWFID